jgi:Tol biopolymer transport system component
MSERTMLKVLLLAMTLSTAINFSCREEPIEDPIVPALPAFDDPVPYSLLGQGKLVFKRNGPPENAYSGIYVIDADQQRLWNIDCGFARGPSVSPDGELIAYTKWGTDQTAWDLYIMNIDGTGQQDITGLTGNENTPGWTFDGTRILYSLDCFYSNTNNIEALYSQSPVPNPSDRLQILDYNAIDPPNFLMGEGLVSSSSSGKLLVLQSGLRTFDADGSNMDLILPYDANSDHEIRSPAWSPDESKIAFLSFKRNSDIAVVLLNPDGTDPDTLISLPASGTNDWLAEHNQISLCWSPDGAKIAFTLPDGEYVGSHIYIIGKDRTGLTQITFEGGVTDFSLSWSQ